MKRQIVLLLAGLLIWPAISQAAPASVRAMLQANNIVVLRAPALNPADGALEAHPPNFSILPIDVVNPFGLIMPIDRPRFIILPDGRFAVAYNGVLRIVDGDGNEVGSVDFFKQINGLDLGPNGEIIVMTKDDIILWNLGGDLKTATYDVADGTVPCLMPNGVLAFAVGSTLKFLDLNSGKIVKDMLSPKGFPVQGLAHRADGAHAIVAGNFLWLFDDTLEKALAGPVLVAGSQPEPVFLPNGDLLVVGDNSLTQLDGETLDLVQEAEIPGDTIMVGAAVVPHRFEADLDGFLAQGDGTVIKVKAPAVVSWTPGSGRTVLQIGSVEAAKRLGDTFTYLGSEGDDLGVKGQRLVAGSQTLRTQSSFGADAFGVVGANNFYYADGFNGQVQAALGTSVLVGVMDSKGLLNGSIVPID